MPNAPLRPCTYRGCVELVADGRCAVHRAMLQREQDARRGSAYERGYGSRWQKASKAWLRSHPLCQCPDCQEGKLRTIAATVVDHIIPHKGDMRLFWDNTNWQSMSKTCHDIKTAREDGGFGRAVSRK